MNCPLCLNCNVVPLAQVPWKFNGQKGVWDYFQCEDCSLVFVDPAQRWSPEVEKARYEQHNNDPEDDRYEAFLRRLWDPLRNEVEDKAEGLDYGCGPTQALAVIAGKDGYRVESYDPFFFNDPKLLMRQYDFLFCSEVVEHFYHPAEDFQRLNQLLAPGGILAVMTGRLDDWSQFAQWPYQNDPCHVCFYPVETMTWIAETYGYEERQVSQTVHLLKKPLSGSI